MKQRRSILKEESLQLVKELSLKLDVYGASDTGKVREHNEDSFVTDYKNGVFLVADGVGGGNAGEIASRIAAQVFPDMLIQHLNKEKNATSVYVYNGIRESLQELNKQILLRSQINLELSGMATTIVLSVIRTEGVYVAHVGDSRAYLIRGKSISQLMLDHSRVAMLVAAHKLTEAEARVHPSRHVITSCLGQEFELETEITFFKPEANDVLILCSDGLTEMIDDERILHIVLNRRNSERTCTSLISAALDAGGKDNVTVIVARWREN